MDYVQNLDIVSSVMPRHNFCFNNIACRDSGHCLPDIQTNAMLDYHFLYLKISEQVVNK